jgi:hypothetical protein
VKIRAIGDNILCTDGDFGNQTTESGIFIKSNAGESQGITARWFKIFECGPDVDGEIYSRVGWWVLVSYGRWTEAMEMEDHRLPNGKAKVWKIDPEACLAISQEKPNTFYYNTDVVRSDRKSW